MTTSNPITSVPSVPMSSGVPGRWSVAGAIAFVAIVMGTAMLTAFGIQIGYESWRSGLMPDEVQHLPAPGDPVFLMSVQLAGQLVQLALIWGLSGLWHRDRSAALGIAPVRLSAGQWTGAIVLLFAVKLVATMVAAGLTPADPKRELGPFVELVRSPDAWLVFLAAVVLAGLTEELLFRGVLSRTLEATRLGFWGGAALASAAFALLHMQYGSGGQLVIFAVGMTLAWIRAWSGSVWPAVVCHALNNALALLAMRAAG
jgi:membrane protease YdiL (CAAX protease family)